MARQRSVWLRGCGLFCAGLAASIGVVAFAFAFAFAFVFALGFNLAFAGETRSPRAYRVERNVLAGHDRAARRVYPSSPIFLPSSDAAPMAAFPPAGDARNAQQMTVVYLHGIHGRATNGCPWFRAGTSELGWLVCPEAPVRDAAEGTASWGGNGKLNAATLAAATHASPLGDAEPGVVIGFSQGGRVAVDLVNAGLARFKGLVLIGIDARADVAKLRAAGVARVALAAGERDGSFFVMRQEAARLARAGVDVRFYDLGTTVGHSYVPDDMSVLRDAIVWAGRGDGEPAVSAAAVRPGA